MQFSAFSLCHLPHSFCHLTGKQTAAQANYLLKQRQAVLLGIGHFPFSIL
jgi:hypothetical protein